jgi:hypothetical protein
VKYFDPVGWIIAAILTAFMAGVGVGGNFHEEQVVKDCTVVGKFRVERDIYDCKPVPSVE